MFLDWSTQPLPPADAYDSTGRQIPGEAIALDTESGTVELYATDAAGDFVIDPEAGDLLRYRRQFSPPILVYPRT